MTEPGSSRSKACAVFFANGIGDAILTLPALRAVERHVQELKVLRLPGKPIDVVYAEFRNRMTDVAVRPIANGFDFDAVEAAAAIGACDTLVLAVTWWSPAIDKLVSSLSPRQVLFPAAPEAAPSRHYFEIYMDAVRPLIDPDETVADYAYCHTTPDWQSLPADLLANLRSRGPIWVVHPDTKAEKTFPPDVWRSTLLGLLEMNDDGLVLVVGRFNAELSGMISHERLLFVPSIFALASWAVTNAELVIGVDSCFMHYADLQRRPLIAIFKATDPSLWGPCLSPSARVLDASSLSEAEFSLELLDQAAAAHSSRSAPMPAASLPPYPTQFG